MFKKIKNFSLSELKDLLKSAGFDSFRAEQIFNYIYVNKKESFDEMAILPAKLRQFLSETFNINSITDYKFSLSKDGTKKFLFSLTDNNKIESVLIPDEKDTGRLTLCVSSQVGCTLNCTFCATGKLPFMRSLESAEIIDQFMSAEKISGQKITNIVFMGMGEPLYNLKNVIVAIKILSDPKVTLISQRRITVSTVGVIKKIQELAEEGLKVKLAISLHATTDKTRNMLIPYSEKVNMSQLGDAIEYFYRKTKQNITYEYIYLEGINNSDEDVKRLAKITKRVPSKVNIIPYHDISFTGAEAVQEFKVPTRASIDKFSAQLRNLGVNVFCRTSSGFDIDAACGQLAYSERTNI